MRQLSFYQLFAGKFHDDLSVSVGGDEAVVFFRSVTGHGLKPVGKVCRSVFHSPLFHGYCHGIGNVQFQMGSVLDCFVKGFIYVLGSLFRITLSLKTRLPYSVGISLDISTALLSI